MPTTSAPITLVPSTVVLSARSTGTQANSPPRSVSSIATAITTAPVTISTGAELAEQLGQFTASVAALAESIRRSVGGNDADVESCDDAGGGGGGDGSACGKFSLGRGSERSTTGGSVAGNMYQVASSFSAVEDDSTQLSLLAGDLIRVHCRDASGWTFGRLECPCGGETSKRSSCVGKMGWFPEAVLLVSEEEKENVKDGRACADLEQAPKEDDIKSGCASSKKVLEASNAVLEESLREKTSRSPSQSLKKEPLAESSQGVWCDIGDTGSTPKKTALSRPALEELTENLDPLDRLAAAEEQKIRQCEGRLADAARARRRYLGAFETAGRGATEAADEIETAEKRLAALEEQARKCRAEVACVASSTSCSMKQAADAKLRALEARKENANINLIAAQERLGQERHILGVARDRSHAESQAAAAAVEALSRQRSLASTAIRNVVQSSGILQPSNSLDHSKFLGSSAPSSPPAEENRRSKAAYVAALKQASPQATTKDARADGDDGLRSRSQSLQRRKADAARMLNGRTSSVHRLAGAMSSRGTTGFPSSGAPPPRANASASRSNLRHRSLSNSGSPNRNADDRGPTRCGLARAPSRENLLGAGGPRRNTSPSTSPGRRSDSETRCNQRPKCNATSARSDSRKRGSEVPKKATEAELNHMLDVLQTAEALQAKLAAMPEHLRRPLAKHCANLHGIIHTEQTKTMSAADTSTMKADIVAALSIHEKE